MYHVVRTFGTSEYVSSIEIVEAFGTTTEDFVFGVDFLSGELVKVLPTGIRGKLVIRLANPELLWRRMTKLKIKTRSFLLLLHLYPY